MINIWMTQQDCDSFSEKNIKYVTSPTSRAEDWGLDIE